MTLLRNRGVVAIWDLVTLEALSDERNKVLLVSDRTLHLLSRLDKIDVPRYHRYAKEFLDGEYYRPVEDGDQDEVDLVDEISNQFGVEVIPVPYNPPGGALIYRTFSAQTFTTGVSADVVFDIVGYDPAGLYQNLSESKVLVPRDGFCYVHGRVVWQGNATGYRQLGLTLNGNALVVNRAAPPGTTDFSHEINAQFMGVAGDYVKLRAFQNSGGNLNIDSPFSNDWQIALSILQV